LQTTNNKIEEIKENSNQQINFSLNSKEDDFLDNKSNAQNKSKIASDRYNNSNYIVNNYNNMSNNQDPKANEIEKESSKLLPQNDLLQQNNNTKSASNRIESKNQRSLAGSNNLLNNLDNSPERLKEHTNNEDNLNLNLGTNFNKDVSLVGVSNNNVINQELLAEVENQMEEELGNEMNKLSEKPDADKTANHLLNSIDNKLINESNTNNISNKQANQNNSNKNLIFNPNNNEIFQINKEALNENDTNNFKNNLNNNNSSYNNSNNNFASMNDENLNNENNFNNLLGLQQKSSFEAARNDLSNSPNQSPNTNFTNTLNKLRRTVYERFRYDFSSCNYFFVDLNEIIKMQNFNFSLKEFSELLRKITFDFREISIITTLTNIIKNIALLDLESLNYISEIVSLTDIYVFEKKEALALFNLLAQLNSESDSSEEKKNLEFLFIREIKRKKRPYPKLGLFLEGFKKCTIIQQQQQNCNLVVFHSNYELNLIPHNVSSVVFEDYQKIFLQNADNLTSAFLGGFFSRFFYKKSFNTCFTAGNESLKRIIELLRFNVEPSLDFNYYLVRIKKNPKGLNEAEKTNKKKEENFVLDSTNVVNSQMRGYNPLYDANLVSFFSSKLTRSHLQKHGFINRNGVIVDDPENKKITVFENSESKNFEKIYEQEKNNMLKIKQQKEKMRLQIKSLVNFNSQTIRSGGFKELDKLAKIYTFNATLSKKLPNIDLKKTVMKTTKFNNNLFLKEISKGNKPKSLFNFNPSNSNNKNRVVDGHKQFNGDIQNLHLGKSSKENINYYAKTNNIYRITAKSRERENSADYFNNSSNNRIKSGNTYNSGCVKRNDNKIIITANNKLVDSNDSKNILMEDAEIKEENKVNANDENLNNEMNNNKNKNENEYEYNKAKNIEDNNVDNNKAKNENSLIKAEINENAENNGQPENLNQRKNTEAGNEAEENKADLVSECNDAINKSLLINGSNNQQEVNNSQMNNQDEEIKKEDHNLIANGENNSQINLSRNGNKISYADLNISKRSMKFDINNHDEHESSKKSKTEENLLHPEINENNLFKNEAKENSGTEINSKRPYEKDMEIDLNYDVSGTEQHPIQIDQNLNL
jgi:hypothetical protein